MISMEIGLFKRPEKRFNQKKFVLLQKKEEIMQYFLN